MATQNYDRGRCLRYKSDLSKESLLSRPTVKPTVVEPVRQSSSFLFWTTVSLILLFFYLVYRRRQDEQEQQPDEEQHDSSSTTTSEYRQSAVRSLPTILEEHPNIFSSNHRSIPLSSSPLALDEYDRRNLSSTSSRQRQNENIDVDDSVQISPHIKQKPYVINRITSKVVKEVPNELNETGHPVIFRKFCTPHENAIRDDFTSIEEVNQAVKDVGLVRSQLIFGIDYTISNLETGKHSFNGLSLHHIQEGSLNPYQSVITIVGRTLEKYDSDYLIPAFGFGDRTTLDRKIFPLRPDGTYCKGFRGVLDAYNKITPKVRMSGPTNFAPLIKEAIRIVKKTGQYHILVIVADGQVTNERQTKEAIVEASKYPLSIVMVGVGDGPWDMMKEFDDSLPTRQFDNFQFVNYNSVLQASTDTDTDFALNALMEIPSQFAAIKQLGLLKDS